MCDDLLSRIREWQTAENARGQLLKEAGDEIERLRERCNELIDEVRAYVMETNPIRYDMNDPLFGEGAYE